MKLFSGKMRMNSFNQLLSGLMGTALLMFHGSVAMAQNKVEDVAREITVEIVIEEFNSPNGSGVLIRQNGDLYYVVTNEHVVPRKGDLYGIVIHLPTDQLGDQPYQKVTLADIDKKKDIALLEFKNNNKAIKVAEISHSSTLSRDQTVIISGYPFNTEEETQDKKPKRSLVSIHASFEGTNNTKLEIIGPPCHQKNQCLIYSPKAQKTQSGMSGGSILNENGALVGIHKGIDENPEDKNQGKGNPPKGVGIPIDTVLQTFPEILSIPPPVRAFW